MMVVVPAPTAVVEAGLSDGCDLHVAGDPLDLAGQVLRAAGSGQIAGGFKLGGFAGKGSVPVHGVMVIEGVVGPNRFRPEPGVR